MKLSDEIRQPAENDGEHPISDRQSGKNHHGAGWLQRDIYH